MSGQTDTDLAEFAVAMKAASPSGSNSASLTNSTASGNAGGPTGVRNVKAASSSGKRDVVKAQTPPSEMSTQGITVLMLQQ